MAGMKRDEVIGEVSKRLLDLDVREREAEAVVLSCRNMRVEMLDLKETYERMAKPRSAINAAAPVNDEPTFEEDRDDDLSPTTGLEEAAE